MNEALSRAYSLLKEELTKWFDIAVVSLPSLVLALILFSVFLLLARTLRGIADRVLLRTEINRTMRSLLAKALTIFVLAVGLFLVLGILGLQKTVASLLAGAGVLGLVVGLAFQDFMSNFFASILISVRKPFDEGDIIKSGDHMGTVINVNLRNTVMKNFEGQQILIPNRLVVEKILENFTRYGSRRVTIAVGVAYESDLRDVATTAVQALDRLPFVLKEPAVVAQYDEFANSSIILKVRFWIAYPGANFFDAQSDAIIAIQESFARAKIDIPFPITTLNVLMAESGTQIK